MRAEKIKIQAHMTTIENEKVDLNKRTEEALKKIDTVRLESRDEIASLQLKLKQKEAELQIFVERMQGKDNIMKTSE